MAAFNAKDVQVTVNSVDLKDHVRRVSVPRNWDTSEKSAMGDTAKTFTLGLRTEEADIEFVEDFASSKVYATINALFVAGTSHDLLIIPVDTTVAATNPSFTLTGYVDNYPLEFGLGETTMSTVHWVNNSTTGIAIATT